MECHVVHSISAQKCHMTHVRRPLLIGTTGFRGLLAGSQPAIMLKEDTHTKERGKNGFVPVMRSVSESLVNKRVAAG